MRARAAIWILGLLIAVNASAADQPITGRPIPAFAPLDQVVIEFMDTTDATAASLSVASNGRIVYARAYGWADEAKSRPTRPENTFRIASNTKPITAAVVGNLIRAKRIAPTTPAFDYLQIKPYQGPPGDSRLAKVTMQNLLEHKGGWDKDQTFDPTYDLDRIKREMGLTTPPASKQLIEYMLTQPLQSTPGETRSYSNFGYLVLGRVVEKATGRKYAEVVETNISKALKIPDLRLSATDPKDRDPGEVFYPRESGLDIVLRDSVGGLTASPSSLCTFMQKYWLNGELRTPNQKRSYRHFGSHPNSTTALMEQRADGVDFAVMFNSRRNDQFTKDNDALQTAVRQAIDQIKSAGN